jgi:regulatory protein
VKGPRAPAQRSLKARALQLLAQREHSRAELRRKLLAHVRAGVIGAPEGAVPEPAPADPAAQVESTLDWLEAHHHLSQERFVESRVHARAARFGNLRIRQELAQHALALSPEAARALQASELERARAVWERKFMHASAGPAEQAKQARFLAGRGFSPDVVRQVLRAVGRGAGNADESSLPDD